MRKKSRSGCFIQ